MAAEFPLITTGADAVRNVGRRVGHSPVVVRPEGFLDNSGRLRRHGCFWSDGFGKNKR